MSYQSGDFRFKSLDDSEEADFRKWPHEHVEEMRAEMAKNGASIFHPVVRDEWEKMLASGEVK